MSKSKLANLTTRKKLQLLRPYKQELGELVFAWNVLHDELAHLFGLVTKIPRLETAFAIWHSTASDSAQRKMLRKAVEAEFAGKDNRKDDLVWLLDQVDQKLSHKRNDAIHGPVAIRLDCEGNVVGVEPTDWSDSPRAKALSGKDLMRELIWYRMTAVVFSQYVSSICLALDRAAQQPWPRRPVLPTAGEKTIPKASRRTVTRHRAHPPQHLPSPK